ncbi:MAG: hypothetical protein KJ872_10590, partial [Alphaproteobacteria bacterium]|nr:hypothetical protein [Alphaproteobacteria bacterium]
VAVMAFSAIERFRAGSSDWLVLVLHGLDGEGWGSIAAVKLEQLLVHCLDKGLVVRPVKDVLATG